MTLISAQLGGEDLIVCLDEGQVVASNMSTGQQLSLPLGEFGAVALGDGEVSFRLAGAGEHVVATLFARQVACYLNAHDVEHRGAAGGRWPVLLDGAPAEFEALSLKQYSLVGESVSATGSFGDLARPVGAGQARPRFDARTQALVDRHLRATAAWFGDPPAEVQVLGAVGPAAGSARRELSVKQKCVLAQRGTPRAPPGGVSEPCLFTTSERARGGLRRAVLHLDGARLTLACGAQSPAYQVGGMRESLSFAEVRAYQLFYDQLAEAADRAEAFRIRQQMNGLECADYTRDGAGARDAEYLDYRALAVFACGGGVEVCCLVRDQAALGRLRGAAPPE